MPIACLRLRTTRENLKGLGTADMPYTAAYVIGFGCYAALLVVNARFKECAVHKFLNVAANIL